ncbi:odorant receptor 10-like, partial [Augochlora pura]
AQITGKYPPKENNGYEEYNSCEEYVNLSIELNRWLLKPIGVWPHSSDVSKHVVYLDWLINFACYFLLSIFFTPCSLYVWFEVDIFYEKLKIYGPLIFCIMTYLKYYSLMVHAADIRECVKQIEWDWRNVQHSEDRRIMIANAYFGRRLVKVCSFFMFGGYIFYNIVMPLKTGKMPVEGKNGSFLPLALPVSSLIIDTNRSPVNEIFFTVQMFSTLVIHFVGAASCSLAASFAVHACGQMQVLMCWMGYLVDGRFDMSKTVNGRLSDIVGQHIRIQTFLKLMEKALTQICLVEYFGSTVDICLCGYYVIVESRAKDLAHVITYGMIMMSFVFNIFIFCYIGELVAEECRKVGETAYMIDWYRLPEKSQLSVVLIMLMSNSSKKLTAGNIIHLTLSSFAVVIKTSVAFLNMLREFSD